MPHLLPLSLADRPQGRIRPELGPLRAALRALGDPQFACPSILIVGTNGKGSSAAILSAVLRAHGAKIGLTTSPHLVAVEERVRIDGEDITRRDLDRHLDRLTAFPELTFFEALTAVAFLAFAEAGVEAAVLEAGLGGSWDATRVAASSIAGITNVGSDHAAWLGDDPRDRARDKGAPLRSARMAVLGPGMAPELVPSLNAPNAVEAASLVTVKSGRDNRLEVEWDGKSLEFELPLAGEHQRANLHLALALARCAEEGGIIDSLEPDAVIRGVADVRWPGRLSEQRVDGRTILVDGAHNLESAQALADHLERLPRRYNLLFSCLDDKPVEAMAGVLRAAVGEVAVVELEDERAMPRERLAAAFPGARVCRTIRDALDEIEDPVVAAGSLRLVGELMVSTGEGATDE